MRIYMQTPAGSGEILRFYHLMLQPDLFNSWVFIREQGDQGRSGRISKRYFPDREQAEAALLRFRDLQLKRGYQVVFMELHHTS